MGVFRGSGAAVTSRLMPTSVGKGKASKPPVFYGEYGSTCNIWLEQFEQYCKSSKLDAESRLLVALMCLKGAAGRWYCNLELEFKRLGSGSIKSWAKLKRLLQREYSPDSCLKDSDIKEITVELLREENDELQKIYSLGDNPQNVEGSDFDDEMCRVLERARKFLNETALAVKFLEKRVGLRSLCDPKVFDPGEKRGTVRGELMGQQIFCDGYEAVAQDASWDTCGDQSWFESSSRPSGVLVTSHQNATREYIYWVKMPEPVPFGVDSHIFGCVESIQQDNETTLTCELMYLLMSIVPADEIAMIRYAEVSHKKEGTGCLIPELFGSDTTAVLASKILAVLDFTKDLQVCADSRCMFSVLVTFIVRRVFDPGKVGNSRATVLQPGESKDCMVELKTETGGSGVPSVTAYIEVIEGTEECDLDIPVILEAAQCWLTESGVSISEGRPVLSEHYKPAVATSIFDNPGKRSSRKPGKQSTAANDLLGSNGMCYPMNLKDMVPNSMYHDSGSRASYAHRRANTRAVNALLCKLQEYVPYDSSVAHLYGGAGVIEYVKERKENYPDSALLLEKDKEESLDCSELSYEGIPVTDVAVGSFVLVQLTEEAHQNRPKLPRWLSEFGERYGTVVNEIQAVVYGVKIRFIDAPGLKCSATEQAFSRNVLASVIRMFQSYLRADTFQRALATYIKKYACSNAKTEDLWAVLEKNSGDRVNKDEIIWIYDPGISLNRLSDN